MALFGPGKRQKKQSGSGDAGYGRCCNGVSGLAFDDTPDLDPDLPAFDDESWSGDEIMALITLG